MIAGQIRYRYRRPKGREWKPDDDPKKYLISVEDLGEEVEIDDDAFARAAVGIITGMSISEMIEDYYRWESVEGKI